MARRAQNPLKPAPEDRRRTWPCRCASTGLAPAMTIRRARISRGAAWRPTSRSAEPKPPSNLVASCPCASGRWRRRGRGAAAERNVFQCATNVSLSADVAGSFWTILDFSIVLRSPRKSLYVSDFSIFSWCCRTGLNCRALPYQGSYWRASTY